MQASRDRYIVGIDLETYTNCLVCVVTAVLRFVAEILRNIPPTISTGAELT